MDTTTSDAADDTRREAAAAGEAMPDGRYLARDCQELSASIVECEREHAGPTVRRFLIKRSIELGCTDKIPDSWRVSPA